MLLRSRSAELGHLDHTPMRQMVEEAANIAGSGGSRLGAAADSLFSRAPLWTMGTTEPPPHVVLVLAAPAAPPQAPRRD
jgi:hypothetical protein